MPYGGQYKTSPMPGFGGGQVGKRGPAKLRSVRHGGHTGHFAGGKKGVFAASPHSGGTSAVGAMPRGTNPVSASPFNTARHARSTGFGAGKGKMGYNAGNPQMPTIAGARGGYQGSGPGGMY